MPTPIPNNSPGSAPVHILHSHSAMIRKSFCYTIELNVVARQGRPEPTFRSFLPQTPVDTNPPAANKSGTSTSRAVPSTARGELAAHENGQSNDSSLKHRSREVQRLDHTNTPSNSSKKTNRTSLQPTRVRPSSVRRRLSKRAKILEVMKRPGGTTLAEIVAFSGWQAHTVRAFVSTVAKKDRIRILSVKNKVGGRVYVIRG